MAEKLNPKQQYGTVKDSPVTPAPSEWFPQDIQDKPADPNFNDVAADSWLAGHGSPHPYFDHGREGREKK